MSPRVANANYYRGRTVALTTKHGKEEVILPPLASGLGLVVSVVAGIDTDLLGTFTGETEREGTPRDTAIRKARLGMQASGLPLGIASEGSFGPHPVMPWGCAADHEILAFVDDELGITVVEGYLTEETNFDHARVGDVRDLDAFLRRVEFPSHALIVRPGDWPQHGLIFKGITEMRVLEDAVGRCVRESSDGMARVETDMRAHMNPTRRKAIACAAVRIAERLGAQCPACGCPGWGRVGLEKGLPCVHCGTPTEMIRHEIFGCAKCDCKEVRPRSDGLAHAEEGQCPYCNP